MSNGLIALVVMVVLTACWLVSVFNRLARSRSQLNEAFDRVDAQLKRRHDLIPELISSARVYLQHERQALQSITVARQRASEARSALSASFGRSSRAAAASRNTSGRTELLEVLDRAESGLTTALAKFELVVEAYPELRSDRTLRQLTEALAATEKRIGVCRHAFNDAATCHNDVLKRFPASLVASACGFSIAGQLRTTVKARGRSPAVADPR